MFRRLVVVDSTKTLRRAISILFHSTKSLRSFLCEVLEQSIIIIAWFMVQGDILDLSTTVIISVFLDLFDFLDLRLFRLKIEVSSRVIVGELSNFLLLLRWNKWCRIYNFFGLLLYRLWALLLTHLVYFRFNILLSGAEVNFRVFIQVLTILVLSVVLGWLLLISLTLVAIVILEPFGCKRVLVFPLRSLR